MDAILAHPYSGAIYGYFSDQLGGEYSHTKVANTHGYYKTLYGKRYEYYVDVALTFLLMYDEVWITPADNHLPQSRSEGANSSFTPELGLHTDWDGYFKNSENRDDHVRKYLEEESVKNVLANTLGLPEDCWEMILRSAIYEAGLSAKKRLPLMCSPGRKALISCIVEIDKPAMRPVMPELHQAKFITSYQNLTGMALSPRNLEDLMSAKQDKLVRQYGQRFLQIAMEEGEGATDIKVAELIREAIETERVGGMLAGGLDWVVNASRMLQEPISAGTVGAASAAVNHLAAKAGWYEFSGSVDKAIGRAQMLRKVEHVLRAHEGEA